MDKLPRIEILLCISAMIASFVDFRLSGLFAVSAALYGWALYIERNKSDQFSQLRADVLKLKDQLDALKLGRGFGK